jgi:hypothetical protein
MGNFSAKKNTMEENSDSTIIWIHEWGLCRELNQQK